MSGLPGFLETRELAENYQRCMEYTRAHASTFYFASFFLPAEKRKAAFAVYSFCRYADNIVDASTVTAQRHRGANGIDSLRDQLRYLYSSSAHMDTKLIALRDTVMRYEIPERYFLDLLRGLTMDLDGRQYASFEDVKDYCYCVASTVGLIMARIFGVSSQGALQHAENLGIAMQLTNILRDIGEDLRRGRVYLPMRELEHFGYPASDLSRMLVTDSFRSLMQFQIGRARDYYRKGVGGITTLPRDGSQFCARLMATTYSRILDDIEANDYDVFLRRAHVPFSRKCAIAASSAFRLISPGRPTSSGSVHIHQTRDPLPEPNNEYSWIQ
jgi:phytoene synthase